MTAATKLRAVAPAAAGGGIDYESNGGVATSADGTATSIAVSVPAGSNGELLVGFVFKSGPTAGGASIATPTGWTLAQETSSNAGRDSGGGGWYRLRDGTEGATVTWTWASQAYVTGVILAYSGVDQTTPTIDASANDQRLNDATPPMYAGTFPTHSAGDWGAFYCMPNAGTAISALTTPAALNERVNTIVTQDQNMAIGDVSLPGSAPSNDDWATTGQNRTISGLVLMKAA